MVGMALLKGDFVGALKALFENALLAVGASPATVNKLLARGKRPSPTSSKPIRCRHPHQSHRQRLPTVQGQLHHSFEEWSSDLAVWFAVKSGTEDAKEFDGKAY